MKAQKDVKTESGSFNIDTQIGKETEKIYQTAPPTNSKAYQQAQKALKENEELTFSKEEIDRFLPEQLHYDSPIHQDNLQRHIIAE